MYIKEINIKTFGGIENKTYNFSDGLNVLFGANESGKSTVIAFIKYIFYGISGRKSEFKRYVPLSGEPMCGSITVCGDNCEYEIFRTSKGAKAKQISVVNKVNGDVMSVDFAQNIGKNLFSLGEDAFLNTLFVSNISSKISGGDGEISARLSNLAQSGDENTSQEKICKKIDEDILNLSSPKRKNAVIPTLETELSNLDERLYKANENSGKSVLLEEKFAKIKSALEKAEEEKEKLEHEKNIARLGENGARIEKLQNEIKFSQDELNRLNDEFSSFDMSVYDGIKNISEEEETRFLSEKDDNFSARLMILGERRKNLSSGKKTWFALLIASLAMIAVFAFVMPVLCIAAAVLGVVSAYLYISNGKKLNETSEEFDKTEKQKEENEAFGANFLKKVNLLSKADYISKKNAYTAVLSQREVLRAKINSAQGTLLSKQNELESLSDALLKEYGETEKDALLEKLKSAKPTVSQADAEKLVKEKMSEIANLMRELNKTEFEIYSVKTGTDDVLSLEEQIENTKSALKEKRAELEIITSAKEIFEYAVSSQQSNFAPSLAKKVSGIFSQITNGAHSDVLIDKTFGARYKKDGGYADETILSKGALDQLYFALRFGIIDMINEKNAPVFLDDAFSQYDDLRFKTVFSYLSDYAKHTQVIISACRENEIYQNTDNINIIKL
ncbi:ATP-binding protein [Qingrenia yutianensis]|uniref:AAA family ATPase n=1 Tax=Qingrenia yutianensis TaxID=2763676 RepID=A0A926FBX4_9FIRM|nr:AAA family ATPase [Qingrenia yutianensis]MBC8596447.1 AAA family ATPase [Qingrenia yutianensis]